MKTLVILEMANNHMGSLTHAKKIVTSKKRLVYFQKKLILL
jgi:sialic acid synthase SpsE